MPRDTKGARVSETLPLELPDPIPFTSIAILPPAAKRYLSGLADACETAAQTTDSQVAALALIAMAPGELSRLMGRSI